MVIVFVVVLAALAVLGAVWASRRRSSEVHSVEGYQNALSTLQTMRAKSNASAVRVLEPGNSHPVRVGGDAEPRGPMPLTLNDTPPGGLVFDDVSRRPGANPPRSTKDYRRRDRSMAVMNRRPRRVGGAIAAGLVVVALVAVLLIIGSSGNHHPSSPPKSSSSSSANHTASAATGTSGGSTAQRSRSKTVSRPKARCNAHLDHPGASSPHRVDRVLGAVHPALVLVHADRAGNDGELLDHGAQRRHRVRLRLSDPDPGPAAIGLGPGPVHGRAGRSERCLLDARRGTGDAADRCSGAVHSFLRPCRVLWCGAGTGCYLIVYRIVESRPLSSRHSRVPPRSSRHRGEDCPPCWARRLGRSERELRLRPGLGASERRRSGRRVRLAPGDPGRSCGGTGGREVRGTG